MTVVYLYKAVYTIDHNFHLSIKIYLYFIRFYFSSLIGIEFQFAEELTVLQTELEEGPKR